MIIRRKSLVTVDILYWMPDYDNILQEFVWQTKDVVAMHVRNEDAVDGRRRELRLHDPVLACLASVEHPRLATHSYRE